MRIFGLGTIKADFYTFIGGLIVLLFLAGALGAPVFTRFDPTALNPAQRLEAPSAKHLMGTDELGRDIWSRLLYGSRASAEIGFSVVALATLLGVGLGLLSGYYRKIDRVLMRLIDIFMAFPGIIIAIFLAAFLGPGKLNIIAALSFAYFSGMSRIVRGSVLHEKELEYIDSAKTAGAKDTYILTRYILPNVLSPVIVQATFIFALAVLDEAALSFLGIGIKAPQPSWGAMISDAKTYMTVAPWTMLFPGLALSLVVLGLNLLGDGLRDLELHG
ncbi:MAG: ABC transporter permease [Syntrophobacteraceae bacterium]